MRKFIAILKNDIMKTISTLLLLMIFGGQVFSLPVMLKQMHTMSDWVVSEMVRQVSKQYTKIIEKPGDLYQDDVEYVINVTWPSIPDARKSETLIMQYEFIMAYYKKSIIREISEVEMIKKEGEYDLAVSK